MADVLATHENSTNNFRGNAAPPEFGCIALTLLSRDLCRGVGGHDDEELFMNNSSSSHRRRHHVSALMRPSHWPRFLISIDIHHSLHTRNLDAQ